jgi:hypothetical protein
VLIPLKEEIRESRSQESGVRSQEFRSSGVQEFRRKNKKEE